MEPWALSFPQASPSDMTGTLSTPLPSLVSFPCPPLPGRQPRVLPFSLTTCGSWARPRGWSAPAACTRGAEVCCRCSQGGGWGAKAEGRAACRCCDQLCSLLSSWPPRLPPHGRSPPAPRPQRPRKPASPLASAAPPLRTGPRQAPTNSPQAPACSGGRTGLSTPETQRQAWPAGAPWAPVGRRPHDPACPLPRSQPSTVRRCPRQPATWPWC